jgi:hypothetical protein
MKNLKKLLFAAVLVAAAIASTPKTVSAVDWCAQCEATGECFPCCKCDGNTTYYCAFIAC